MEDNPQTRVLTWGEWASENKVTIIVLIVALIGLYYVYANYGMMGYDADTSVPSLSTTPLNISRVR